MVFLHFKSANCTFQIGPCTFIFGQKVQIAPWNFACFEEFCEQILGASDSFSRTQNFANFSKFSPLRGEIMSNCHFQVKPTASKTNFSLVYRYFWRFWQSLKMPNFLHFWIWSLHLLILEKKCKLHFGRHEKNPGFWHAEIAYDVVSRFVWAGGFARSFPRAKRVTSI